VLPAGQTTHVPGSRRATVSVRCPRTISADRHEKRPPIHRCLIFATWQGLCEGLPASALAPFVVELFTVELLSPERRARSRPGSGPRGPGSSPRRPRCPNLTGLAPELPQSGCGPNPTDRICTPRRAHRLCTVTTSPTPPKLQRHRQGFSPSPRFALSGEPLDRTRRFAFAKLVASTKFYFREPPSSWTSHSRGIQLYGATSLRLVRPLPSLSAGKAGLPGDVAPLNGVRNAFFVTDNHEPKLARPP
jgi:hypothetical protein